MAYVELHCHSHFSLLDGASSPEELVTQAAALEMPALALTDHDAVYGAPRFLRAAREQGLRPILGAELTLAGGYHLTLLVENEAGWHNLCYLISRARHAANKGEASLPPAELVGCTNGLIALSGCRKSEIAGALLAGDREKALAIGRHYRELFGREQFWIELQRHFIPGEEAMLASLVAMASYLRLGCVATNNVHYAIQEGHRLQDILVCIRHRTTLDVSRQLRRPNSEYYLKSAGQMATLFAPYPEAVANTVHLAERCHFELRYGLQDLPHFPTPYGMSSGAYLRRLCEEALSRRYSQIPGRVRDQLHHELDVIERAGLANYFLIVWDIVRFAREQGIRCQGRGSAANSLVAYLLHISPIDPLAHDLVFERFLSAERQVVPDIDLDFDAGRREEVIQYLYRRYGEAHTAMACTFVTFQKRSALRDTGKALGLAPEAVAEVLARDAAREGNNETQSLSSGQPSSLLLELGREIADFPRHLGIHAGGMIITGAPLMGRVPTEPATMPGRVVVQWDKEGLEDVGLVKIDVLGLRMLSAISETLAIIAHTTGRAPDLDGLTFDDPAVYEMISEADTIGVFQVESRAQVQVLPRLRPRCFNDLIVAISLIRPGPIQGNMVHPYVRRRLGVEPVSYLHPLLEPALKETLGVILFQEQVLKIARDLAGFTPGQGEQLRRALGAKRAEAEIEGFRTAFLDGAQAKGVPPDVAETVFEQLRAFGSYSFPKSHATAFAIIVYQSAWLKHYHFVPFYTALLNNQPMGFWTPAVLVNECRRRGVPVLPVDLQSSQARCAVEEEGIRLGFNYVKGLGEGLVSTVIKERERAPFASLADFCGRTRLRRTVVERLILAGAMDGWAIPRRHLLWELGTLEYQEEMLDLVFPADDVALPPLSPAEAMLAEYEALGLSTGDHVMAFCRPWLASQGVLDSEQLAACADGQRVRTAGLVVVHQSPPTARGHHFLCLEDSEGMVNVIIRPQVYEQHRQLLYTARLLIVEGVVQQKDDVINVLATSCYELN
ncbi:MAG: error-prone DNA polymerase [Chloroflexi bacterium]|nr:error-prone DNA polymerase [Chloroflexota bacterium]